MAAPPEVQKLSTSTVGKYGNLEKLKARAEDEEKISQRRTQIEEECQRMTKNSAGVILTKWDFLNFFHIRSSHKLFLTNYNFNICSIICIVPTSLTYLKLTLPGLPPPKITVETRYDEQDFTEDLRDVTLYPEENL